MTRRLIGQALRVVGVEPDTVSDVEIALSEACANVLRHVQVGDAYEVRAGFDQQCAFLEIIDQGGGFNETASPPDDDSESGRGVALMRALMDEVQFETHVGDGSSVKLEKRLRFLPNSPIQQLGSAAPTAAPTAEPTA
jgi:serine/threonine-protein kinase RsbW